jgi:hypothetical protein
MTWTYGGDPSANLRDEVRWRAGLTDPNDQLVSDEEIGFALVSVDDDPVEAAALACEHVAKIFSRRAEAEQLGRRREEYGDRAAKFQQRAHDIRVEGGSDAAGVNAPQIYVSERESALTDLTRVPTAFRKGMMRNRGDYY